MRKNASLLILLQLAMTAAFSQYWQQQVNYTIDVTLNDKSHSLDAFEKIEYINHSPDTLEFIWFHTWPNAYKNDRTSFSNQMLVNNDTKFYFSDKEQRGYINRLDFTISNTTCTIEDHPQFIDVVKVILPTPLAPGQKIVINTPFHVQLPFNFSRGGHDGQSYQVTQWYPKPAVYDKNGWHAMPYLEQGEYYSEFGNFDVRITLPKNYVVAATGELRDEVEKQWMRSRNNYSWEPVRQKTKIKGGGMKITVQKFPPSSSETKTLRYAQDSVHDFAWFADKRFIVNHDTCTLSTGKIIEVYSFYTPAQKNTWKNSIAFAKRAVRFYSGEMGEYPYNIVSAVQGPESFGGGMEYPTITVIAPTDNEMDLDITLAHEIGHNWFYGILASNERKHPWMDEGINSYYDHRYSVQNYPARVAQDKALFETFANEKLDQPIETKAEEFSNLNYPLVAYYKTAAWLRWLEKKIGTAQFSKGMKDYYDLWKFKHPQPLDFKQALEQSSGQNLDESFTLLSKTGGLPGEERKGTKINAALPPNYFNNLFSNNYRNFISVGPAIGANSYDHFMAGIFLTNVSLPLNRFKFFLVPMYSFGSKEPRGIGKLDYSFYPGKLFRKIDLFLNAETFAQDEFSDSAGNKTYQDFKKIVPGIRFTLKEKDPKTSRQRYIQWKTFFFGEESLEFSRDTIGSPPAVVTNIRGITEHRYLNQLTLSVENFRALYPYHGQLKLEQSEDFIRAAFTATYFFNYPKNGGLNVRLFAGKFIYTGEKTSAKEFATERFHLNMTGASGYEDYTYSDYFIGRNKFDHLPSQQIMVRDGGFKIRTDLLASPVGRTDDWLVATNLTSSVPSSINPLHLLPVKIPLYVFFDLGTYADAWKKDAEGDRFLFDAGVQLSFLKNTINVYLPLIYSSIYKDYVQSTLEKKNRMLKKISFSIDISNFNPRKIDKIFSF